MGKLKEFHIVKDEDILFFYDLVMKHRGLSVVNRKSINSLSNKYNIEITKEKAETCNSFICEPDKITIYDDYKGLNQRFFCHLRNAFAHCYIEISGDRCRFLDWNAFKGNKKSRYGKNKITLLGDVNYEDFKKLMNEFFLPQSIINKKIR